MTGKKTVWVVEDDAAILEVTQLVLDNAGYTAVGISTEDELFKKLAKEKPDLLLLDLLISGSDGRSIAKKIKESDALGDFPIIFMSANTNIEDKVVEGKADGYIKKPFDIDELINIVKNYTAEK